MQPSDPIRVVIIDDQAILRAGFRHLLEHDCGFQVVGEAENAAAGIEVVRTLRPDIVTLDLTMPGLSGIDALPKLSKASPRTRFIMLTSHESGRFLQESLRAGAMGFLTKDSQPEELRVAISSVHEGHCYITPRVTAAMVDSFKQVNDDEGSAASPGLLGPLSAREREVFQLLALGKPNKEIAGHLDIAVGTVKKHRENLHRKLNTHSTAELARIAIQEGLL